MDEWKNLCRCCLSPNSEVSLFDSEEEIKEKFLETTTIEVKENDGLPQKLCHSCVAVMESAHQFRKQCLRIDSELKTQLTAIINSAEHSEFFAEDEPEAPQDNPDDTILNTIPISDSAVKDLNAIVKNEPQEDSDTDGDDDCYYVLVIDDEKEKEKEREKIVKLEPTIQTEPTAEEVENFENSIDSFLVTNHKTPSDIKVENILPVDSVIEDNDKQTDDVMDVEDDLGNQLLIEHDSQQENQAFDLQNTQIIADNNIIKILTESGNEGILEKLTNKGQYVTYITDGPLGENGELSQEEVIVCDGDNSQLQLLNLDQDLVIEYTDEDQIATVIQQEDGTFLCECGVILKELSEYEKHQYTHQDNAETFTILQESDEMHTCSLCGKTFETSEILTGHMLLHKNVSLLVACPFCNLVIKRGALTQHIKFSHCNIKPKCNICYKTFANPNNLKRHMLTHTGVREFECDICLKTFSQKITMQTHRLTHSLENKTFSLDNSLKLMTESGETVGYACQLCNKMFSMSSALQSHVDSCHYSDTSELCSECGEVFSSKKSMCNHALTIHKKQIIKSDRRFICSTCNKSCSSQAMLIMHERVHTNERPYGCESCSLKFKTKTHLRTHQLTHTREKKFGCSVCMKFFALKGNLVVHLRTHTGERPYICNICEDAFIDSKYLKKHKLKRHAISNVPWNEYYKVLKK